MDNLPPRSLRSRLRAAAGQLSRYARLARTTAMHALRLTDRDKWTDYAFPPEWTMRLKRIGQLVPEGSNVFEFGAGPVGLRPYLPPGCRLVSSDAVQHNPELTIIDLNRRPLPDLEDAPNHVAILAGVLEYISDVPSLLSWAGKHFALCIASYECAKSAPRVPGRTQELLDRTHMGWVNHYAETELLSLFATAGFDLVQRTSWGAEDDPGYLFVFRLRSSPLSSPPSRAGL